MYLYLKYYKNKCLKNFILIFFDKKIYFIKSLIKK